LVIVDISRASHYKTDVAKPHAPKNQASNGELRNQEQRNFTWCWMFLCLAAVDIARNAHYKTDVAKPNRTSVFLEHTFASHLLNLLSASPANMVIFDPSLS
jgi:Ulp1 family protease